MTTSANSLSLPGDTSSPPGRRSAVRFWLYYAAAWLLYLPFICAAMQISSRESPMQTVRGAIGYVTSAAILGLGVYWACQRWPLQNLPRARGLSIHFACALFFSGTWSLFVFCGNLLQSGLVPAWEQVRPYIVWHFISGLSEYGFLAGVFTGLNTVESLRLERQRAARAEVLRVQAEYDALRGRLQPHFLFNTLHSITALVPQDPARAEQALLQLGDLLRIVLDAGRDRDEIPFSEEWRFVQRYLALEQMRLGSRLRIEAEIAPDALQHRIPFFTLQPLVENAIRHAVAARAGGGTVRIAARVDDQDRLRIEVGDDGPGADAAALAASRGLGLRAVRQRLEARHGNAAALEISTGPGMGFRATALLPASA
jgi:signal transduction histidine kinase